MKQHWHHKISSALSFFTDKSFDIKRLNSLSYGKYISSTPDELGEIPENSKYLLSIIEKILNRGELTFIDYEIEN